MRTCPERCSSLCARALVSSDVAFTVYAGNGAAGRVDDRSCNATEGLLCLHGVGLQQDE